MSKEALPFDPERWPALQAEGWTLSVCGLNGHKYVGVTSYDWVVCERAASITQAAFERVSMLPPIPPPVVIEFKVGLYKSANRTHWLSLHEGMPTDPEDKFRFIRWLTPDELAKGEVRVEG